MRKTTLHDEFRAQSSDGTLNFAELNFALIKELTKHRQISQDSLETIFHLLREEKFIESSEMHFILSTLWNDGPTCSARQLVELRMAIENTSFSLIAPENAYALIDAIVHIYEPSESRLILAKLNKKVELRSAVKYGFAELDRLSL